jgi:hypothetical protein
MTTLAIWYGLPGSGKTTRLNQLRSAGYAVYDDFMRDPHPPGRSIRNARCADELLDQLRRGQSCAIADIQLCFQDFRTATAQALLHECPQLSIDWNCFDCRSRASVERCRENLNRKGDQSMRTWLYSRWWIYRHAHQFTLEPGANVHEIH